MWLLFAFFERLGDEYFSWWYVQHMLPYLSMALVLAGMRAFLNCDFCVCPFLKYFLKSGNGIETPDSQWY